MASRRCIAKKIALTPVNGIRGRCCDLIFDHGIRRRMLTPVNEHLVREFGAMHARPEGREPRNGHGTARDNRPMKWFGKACVRRSGASDGPETSSSQDCRRSAEWPPLREPAAANASKFDACRILMVAIAWRMS
jgi:hypothetical protein